MASTSDKLEKNIQVFLGSKPRPNVFAKHAGNGCCDGVTFNYDKLAERTRFDNALAHNNPLGATDRFYFPTGNGFSSRSEIVDHINEYGEGATISVLAIPTLAYVKSISVKVLSGEKDLEFELITRSKAGTEDFQYTDAIVTKQADKEDYCSSVTREREEGTTLADSFGQLDGDNVIAKDIIGHFSYPGKLFLDADEVALRVTKMPENGVVGDFNLVISVSYEVRQHASY